MTLLRPHVELMYRMAYRWCQSEQDAEDIVQDVLIRLADRVEEMRAVDQLRPWVIKCVYRRYIDLHRRQSSSPIISEEIDDQSSFTSWHADLTDDFQQLADRDSLQKALATLDDKQRDVILLHDAEGYSALEVAEILEEKTGTVKSRLHRGRAALKKKLEAGTF